MKYSNRIRQTLDSIFDGRYVVREIRSIRKEFQVPRDGFENGRTFKAWRSQWILDHSQQEYDVRLAYFKNRIGILLEPFNIHPSSELIKVALFFREPNYSIYKDFNKIEFQLLSVVGKHAQASRGVYIKINPFSNLTDIREFIAVNSKLIKERQLFFRKKNQNKYSLDSKDYIGKRDYLIYVLSAMSSQHLIDSWRLDPIFEYKDQLISRVLKIEGYRVSTDSIKKIIRKMNLELESTGT